MRQEVNEKLRNVLDSEIRYQICAVVVMRGMLRWFGHVKRNKYSD